MIEERQLETSEDRTAIIIGVLDDVADMQLYIEQMARRGYCPAGWPDNMRAKVHNVMTFMAQELTAAQQRNGQLEAQSANVIPLRRKAAR